MKDTSHLVSIYQALKVFGASQTKAPAYSTLAPTDFCTGIGSLDHSQDSGQLILEALLVGSRAAHHCANVKHVCDQVRTQAKCSTSFYLKPLT